MLNLIFVSAFDPDAWAWDGEMPCISVDVPARTPIQAMEIKENLKHFIGDNKYALVRVIKQPRKNNSFIASNLRYTDHVCEKHTIVVSEEDYTSDYYAWCEQMDEKYKHEDKLEAFLAKIEKGFEVSNIRNNIIKTDWLAGCAILESQMEIAIEFVEAVAAEAAATEANTELNAEPDNDDEELPF